MSTIPLELPLRANEAAALADVIFQQLDRRVLNDEQRKRLIARAAGLELSSIRPYWGSLEADPVHGNSYYLAIDAHQGERASHLLLRIAPASAPSSGLFPKAILIGRMRPGAGREIVVSAIPFGIDDHEAIRTFIGQVNRGFQPRPQGTLPSITLALGDADEAAVAEAFVAFQKLMSSTGVNLAAFVGVPEACAWGAIRAGWRNGYSVGVPVSQPEEVIGLVAYTRFSAPDLPIEQHEKLIDLIRSEKLRAGLGRAFDYEVVHPADPAALLAGFRENGRTIQLLAPAPGFDLEQAAALARQYQITLSFHGRDGHSPDSLRGIGELASGRWNYTVSTPGAILDTAALLRS